jgi:oligopeptide transport system substrate-binding protein
VDIVVVRSVGEGLYRDSSEGSVLAAAEKDEVSEDGLTHTFTIRDDAVWSNLEPVTAQDFVFAWRRLADPSTGAEYAYMLKTAGIKNAEAVISGELPVEELGVTAVDDKTLVVECDQYVPFFKDLLINPFFFPLNEEFVTAQGDQYGLSKDSVLYNGVFTVSQWEVGSDTVVLAKNPSFHDQSLSNLDTLTYQTITETQTGVMAYESGAMDVLNISGDIIDQYADSPDLVFQASPTLYYLQPNLSNAYLANTNLRLAIAYALDKDSVCDDILKDGSKPADFIVVDDFAPDDTNTPFREVANKTYLSYNTSTAQSYWEKALQELGTSEVSIELLYDDSDEMSNIAQFLQASLQETLPGLTVTLQVQPKKNRLELMGKGEYDIALTRWGADYNDPSDFLNLFVTGASYNYGGYSSAEYDRLVGLANGDDMLNTAQRFQDFIAAEGVILDEAGIMPLYEVSKAYLVKSNVHIDFTVNSSYLYQFANMD